LLLADKGQFSPRTKNELNNSRTDIQKISFTFLILNPNKKCSFHLSLFFSLLKIYGVLHFVSISFLFEKKNGNGEKRAGEKTRYGKLLSFQGKVA